MSLTSEVLESNRFIPGKNIVRDLCLREKDFLQVNRMWYMNSLRDAFIKLNFKTQMMTKRIALPVIRDTVPYMVTPADYLDLSSIAAENECGKLEPMVINTRIRTGIADLSLVKRCGCDCGCSGEVCSAVRNYETVYGTVEAQMPDTSVRSFTTLYQKIILKDGAYVERKTLPAKKYVNNIHVDTVLETEEHFMCNLELEKCGCVKSTDHNRRLIDEHCHAVDFRFEAGCAVEHVDLFRHHPHDNQNFNVEEDGGRIYLPSNFRHDFGVLRYYANSKTRDIVVPFLAKEPMMSGIKMITTAYDKKATQNDKMFWARQFKKDHDEFKENLSPIMLNSFYHTLLGTHNHRR